MIAEISCRLFEMNLEGKMPQIKTNLKVMFCF